MADIDQDRRDYLSAKFPDMAAPRPPGPALNPAVQTVIAAQQIEARGFTRGTDWHQWLFDPARNPRMHAIATKAHREMRLGISAGDIDCDALNDPNQVLVHFVGSKQVFAVPRGKSADRFGAILRRHDATQPFCDEANCSIQIADECGPSTMLMALLFGGVLLIFECCGMCHHVARELTTDGYKVSEMDAELSWLGDGPTTHSVTPAPPLYGPTDS